MLTARTIVHTGWIDGVEGIVASIGVGVVGLEASDGAAEGVGGEEAAQSGGIVAGKGIVEAGFGIAFVTGEFVAGRAGGGLQPSCVGNFLAVGSEVSVVAELAGRLVRAVVIFPAAGCDGARGAEMIGEEIEESGVAAVGAGDAGGDTTPGEENVLGIVRSDASGAVCFRERFAGN